jgi:hypothetical protein
MGDTPWTPGPWEVSTEDGDTIFVADECCYIVSGRLPDGGDAESPDLDLIALAPEMAAAILRFTGLYSDDRSNEQVLSYVQDKARAIDDLFNVADRLRAIKGDNNE